MPPVEQELLLVRGTGWTAAVLLVLALAPLGRAKRRFGLAALACALVHFASGLATPLVPALELLLYEPQLRAGATALVVLIFLGATSPRPLMDRLGIRHWKPLHRAVYAAALLVFHHVLLSPHVPRLGLIALGVAVGLALAGAAFRALRALKDPATRRRDSGPSS